MPKVGKRHFAYTPAGRKAARRYAKQTGQSMTNDKKRKKRSY